MTKNVCTLAIAFSAFAFSIVLPAQDVPAHNPDGITLLRGTVEHIGAGFFLLNTGSGITSVRMEKPFHLYVRAPSDLSHIRDSSFVGVTTVKQPDGSERATEVHIFPEELRGVGEGSYMMGQGSNNRMTNGTASAGSRMSNGSVKSMNGTTLVVQYRGGSRKVTVPGGTPVTELKLTSKPLVEGYRLAALAKKDAGGSYSSNRVILAPK